MAASVDRARVAELERLLAESVAIVEAIEPALDRPCDDLVVALETHRDARLAIARQIYDRGDLAANVYAYAIRADVRAAVDGAGYARDYTAIAERVWQRLRRHCSGRLDIEALEFGVVGNEVRRPLLGAPLWPRPFVNGRDDREVVDALERFDRVWGAFVTSLANLDCDTLAQRMNEQRAQHAPLIRETIALRAVMTDVQEQLFQHDERDRGLEWYYLSLPCEEEPAYVEAERVLFAQ